MIRDLFNISVARSGQPAPQGQILPPGTTVDRTATTTTAAQREGAFVTTQSLVSFAGATSTVAVLANVVQQLKPAWSGPGLIAVLSVLVGVTIYLISETDPLRRAAGVRDRIIAAVIALVNTCVIFSAAVGANALADTPAAKANTEVEAGNVSD